MAVSTHQIYAVRLRIGSKIDFDRSLDFPF